jgi:hypothetical protein
MKICKLCNQSLAFDNFSKNPATKDKLQTWCRVCNAKEKLRVYREKKAGTYVSKVRQPKLSIEEREQRKLEIEEYHKQYRKINCKKLTATKRDREIKAKAEGIAYYGGKCVCCGESIVEFLTIEHLNGHDKTKKRRTGAAAWLVAKRQGFPDIYTVLCFNCNCAKGIFGECPHSKHKE